MTDLATTAPTVPAERARAVAVAEYENLLAAATQARADAVPERTARARYDDRLAYAEWAVAHGRRPWPADADQVLTYVHHLTTAPRPGGDQPYAPATIERHLSSIRTAHKELGMPVPDTRPAWDLLKAYRRRLAEAKDARARQQQAAPAVPSELRKLVGTLDRSTLAGARDAVLLLLGYATAARISELVALDLADAAETGEGLIVSLYRKKTGTHTDAAVPYAPDPALCPVRALRAYRQMLAAEGRTTGPLFVRIDRHGRIAEPMYREGKPIGDPSGRITPRAAADVIARAAAAAGLTGQWSGHSLRRGFATAAARKGAGMAEICRQGGWAVGSREVAKYIEAADQWTHNPVAYE